MVLPVVLRGLRTQVVHLLESLLAESQGSHLVQAHQHRQLVRSSQPVSLFQQAYLSQFRQQVLGGLLQHRLVHLLLIVRRDRLAGGRLLNKIQYACRELWSDRVCVSLLTRRELGLSYRALIVLLSWACVLLGGTPRYRQGRDSCAVRKLKSGTPNRPFNLPYRMLAFAQSSVVHRLESLSCDS